MYLLTRICFYCVFRSITRITQNAAKLVRLYYSHVNKRKKPALCAGNFRNSALLFSDHNAVKDLIEYPEALFPACLPCVHVEIEEVLLILDHERLPCHIDPVYHVIIVETSGHLTVDITLEIIDPGTTAFITGPAETIRVRLPC